jgi:hypothetical protein
MELTPLAALSQSAAYFDEISEESIEEELKLLFIALFEQHLRTKFRRIDHYGYPHLLDSADFETVQRFVKLDGLNLLNREISNQPYMLEVFRAWRGQHQRRGLGFLEFYLQMLWPNAWKITQWHHSITNISNYPLNLIAASGNDRFLTSRVSVIIDPDILADLSEVVKMSAALQRVVPARIVLNIAVGVNIEPMEMVFASAFKPIVCFSVEDSNA